MKKLKHNKSRHYPIKDQGGFIPLMLCIIAVIAFVIYLVYVRLASMQ